MWLLGTKAVVDADTAAWHFENFEWLARQHCGGGYFSRSQLVLPKRGFFTANGEQGHDLACAIFRQVKHHCGMEDWDVTLVQDDNPLALETDFTALALAPAPSRHALGTFAVGADAIQITYVPALLNDPHQLIATFAHELAHYVLLAADEPPGAADDELECLTDLTAVFMGFGVFLANSRFTATTRNDGWRIGHTGYLPEADLIFALALFLRLKGSGIEDACGCLKPHLASLLRRATKQLLAHDADVERIATAVRDTEQRTAAVE